MWLLDTWSRSKPLEIEDSCCSVPYHPLQEREREKPKTWEEGWPTQMAFFLCVLWSWSYGVSGLLKRIYSLSVYTEAVMVSVCLMPWYDVCFFANSWLAKGNFFLWNESYMKKDGGTKIAVFIETVMLCRQKEPFCQFSPWGFGQKDMMERTF